METAAAPAERLLTATEFGAVIKTFRESRRWTQQQLAEIAGISSRTLQRVERGQPADFDTKRALARAFDLDDIDVFNKPFAIPTAEELVRRQQDFDRSHITLTARPIETGRQLATLAQVCAADMCEPGGDIELPAQEEFAALTDLLREFRECHDLYSEVDKLEIYAQCQEHIDALTRMNVSLRYATRTVALKVRGACEDAKPIPIEVLYLIAFPPGDVPKEFSSPREFRFG